MAGTILASTYQTMLRRRLADADYDGSELLQYISDANAEICNNRRWRFMERVFNGTVTQGESAYELPDGFQAAINFTINAPDANAVFVKYMPYEQFDQLYPDPTALEEAQPDTWTFFGNSLIIGPAAPDQAYTMQLRYLASPAVVDEGTDTLDVPDDFSELIVLGALSRALMTNDQYQEAGTHQANWTRQMASMQSRLQSRQYGESLVVNNGRNKGATRWYD